MILYIDASDNQKTTIKLDNCQVIKEYSFPREQKILEVIAELLKKEGVQLQEINEIKVNTGPGSYTSLRVGCAIANVMSWALKIKINGKNQVTPLYD